MTSRYGRKLDYSDASIDAAAAALASLRSRLAALGPPPDGRAVGRAHRSSSPSRPAIDRRASASAPDDRGPDRAHAPAAPLSADGRALHDRFVAALDDDLDLPTALATVREILRADLPADERRWLVLDADAVLGLDLHRVWDAPAGGDEVPADVLALVEARSAARGARDFAQADALRGQLEAQGWEVVDGPDGSTVRRHAPR